MERKNIVLALVMAAAVAVPFSAAQAVEVGAGLNIGTLGPGAAVTFGVNDSFSARLGFNRWSYDDTITESEIDYDVELELSTTSAFIDWHPGGSGFRVTAGLIGNGNEINGTAKLNQPVEIGDNTYTPAELGQLDTSMDFDSTAPYLGIGWGHAAAKEEGFSFAMDLGVMFQGGPNVELEQSGGTINGTPQQAQLNADLDKEEATVESELDEFDIWPVITVGFAYHF